MFNGTSILVADIQISVVADILAEIDDDRSLCAVHVESHETEPETRTGAAAGSTTSAFV